MSILNIFLAFIFITSKHYAAGSMFDPVVKTVQTTCTDKREAIQKESTKLEYSLKEIFCDDDCYRSYDGTCNNKENGYWGAANTPYGRFWENSYSDGIEKLPFSCSDDCYRSARELSLELYSDCKKHDHNNTGMAISFGQFCVHDLVLGQIGAQVTCCDNGKYTSNQKTHPKCDAIGVPDCDPVYGPAGLDCLNFVRTDTDGCKPVSPISTTTAYLDLSQVYGNNKETAMSLRTGFGGKMISPERDGKYWLPQNMNPMEACFNLSSPDEPCYRAGDPRVNQNAFLTLMHIMFVRYHNDVADNICGKDSSCSDEECYQKARQICIATAQKIFAYDYLTLLLGEEYLYEVGVIHKKCNRDEDGYIDDYSCDCNPAMTVECASAAFRGQHSAIPGILKLYFEGEDSCKDKKKCDDDYFGVTGSIIMSDWMNRPSVIEKEDNSDGLFRGLFAQPQERVDRCFVDGVRHELFKRFGLSYGEDLCARDFERARDHGVPTYCVASLECGTLSKCDCFDDIREHISDKNVDRLEELYCGDVSKVELMAGGMLEENVCGTLAGPLFRCIMAKQFLNTRRGDRYWFENGNQPCPLTPAQLENIRHMTMAVLLCKYGDGIDKVQKDPFRKISKDNPLVDCCELDTLDYSLFQCCGDK